MPDPPSLPTAGDGGRTIDIGNPIGPQDIPLAHKQEDVRRWLALGLVGILALEISIALSAVAMWPSRWSGIKELLIALVGSATGFYFGNKSGGHKT
jgi:hypothetical protein